MSTDNPFLQAIIDNPDDDTPRLIYADWLEERGDARAQYLRLLSALDNVKVDASEAAEILSRLQDVQLAERIDRRWILLMNRGRIIKQLRDFQAGAPRHDWPYCDDYWLISRRWDALPIYADLGGMSWLRFDGELLVMEDFDDIPEPQTNQRWRLISLACGVEYFPELRPLLPPRPSASHSCSRCKGAGLERWQIESYRGLTSCGACCGLGWQCEEVI